MFFFSITLTMALDIDPQWCFGSHPKELVLFLHRLLHSAMVGFLIDLGAIQVGLRPTRA
jgi:hypothetical protein